VLEYGLLGGKKRYKNMERLRKLKQFYNKYERYLIPGALLFGFITDVLTFRLVSFTLAMLILLGHLIFIGINISVINLYEARKITGKVFSYWRVLAPLFLQYSFGNLFSAFLIFYSHSGSFSASWPFIGVIVFLMIGNEVFRKYNIRPTIQISVYFFALFSYTNLVFPHLLNNLSTFIFLGSAVVSVLLILWFLSLLSSYTSRVGEKSKAIKLYICLIFLGMNFLYFTNLIPPIPLSITSVGVYHDIERVNREYKAVTEECENFDKCFFSHERRHISREGESLYLFSAVFAPEGMDLSVMHEWQRYNKEKKKWETAVNIPFLVEGGREMGYRWYTYYNVSPGYWRVNVKTERGQIIGRKNFYVIGEKGVTRVEKSI